MLGASMQIVVPVPRIKLGVPYREPINYTVIEPAYVNYVCSSSKYISVNGDTPYYYFVLEIPTLRYVGYIPNTVDYTAYAPISKDNDFILTIEKIDDYYCVVKRSLEDLSILNSTQLPLPSNIRYIWGMFIFNISNDNRYFINTYSCADPEWNYYASIEIRNTSDLDIISSISDVSARCGYISDNYIALIISGYLRLYDRNLNLINQVEINLPYGNYCKVCIDERHDYVITFSGYSVGAYRIPDLTLVRDFLNPVINDFRITDFDLSRDNRYLAVTDPNVGVFVIDLDSAIYNNNVGWGGHNKAFGISGEIHRVTFSDDCKYLTGVRQYYSRNNIYLWKIEPFKGRNDWVFE